MSSGLKQLKKSEILFREGDTPDAMYVIKSGKIAITKVKGTSEVVLAELGPGDMLGEMAFFDSRPRSAGAKAVSDTTVIVLPFASLNAQFKTFPEWLKAIVRTVNNHLRNANQTIKNLQRSTEEETEFFPPHLVTRLVAIICLVGERFGEISPEGLDVPATRLRNYCIQIFQQPTNKLQKAMELLQSFGYMKVEDLGEGRQRVLVLNQQLLVDFVDFYNDWLFKSEDKRATVDEKDLRAMKALVFYGRGQTANAKGEVKVNLTRVQENAQRDLGASFSADDVNGLIELKLTSEKMTGEDGLAVSFNFEEFDKIAPLWELIHAFRKVQKD